MQLYTRQHPFIASVKERYPLTKQGSLKDTAHVVIDLTGSKISYDVGDCVAIFGVNPPQYVEQMLKGLQATGDEMVLTRHAEHSLTLKETLEKRVNLQDIPKKLIEIASTRHPQLAELLDPAKRNEFKEFVEEREVWDFILEHPLGEVDINELLNGLQPLLPRFYSIASHQDSVGEEVHLTVAHLRYKTRGYERFGICTHYLCNLVPLNDWSVPLYVQAHKGFTLPENPAADVIMIGPGTGVAPYRGFMQKRIWRKDTGRSWLFFGEWNNETDFFYEDFWKNLEGEGKLRLSTAFSRDQQDKVYVQNRMWENADELYNWIQNGAYIFVCGNASHMAKDVEAMLLQILKEKGNMDEQTANQYLKDLRLTKRYLKDVY